jgi:alginate O-acetyltransferase complex protein AlgI
MLFNSFTFFLFFPIVTAGFFILNHRFRWLWLLLASCFFYMYFKPEYILILFFTIIIDYYVGIYLERYSDKRKKKLLLVLSLIANIGILAIFKYYNFLNGNITGLYALFGKTNPIPYLDIILPIGLSFHTFQAMSYTIEVYRGNQPAEKKFGIYALYVMFYPQLVAGPIERPQNIIYQFYQKKTFIPSQVIEGLKRMLWGLFKKVVIADNVAMLVDKFYNDPTTNGIGYLIASILFSFQIYCDFSGYTDIALGAAKTMGFDLLENFNTPYRSKSISEFWSRWHMSLSTWFRDYLYIPLGGNRVNTFRVYFNLFFVFLMSGLWHGAGWNYIVWGSLHGFYLIFALSTKNIRQKIGSFLPDLNTKMKSFIQVITTFILVTFAWIFFRINDWEKAIVVIKKIGGIKLEKINTLLDATLSQVNLGHFFFICLLLFVYVLIDKKMDDVMKRKIFFTKKSNYLVYSTLLVSLILFGFWGKINFIYFQF